MDLQRKFHMSATELATRLGLTLPEALALRRHLAIDDHPGDHHEFVFGSQRIHGYSDNAHRKMQAALDTVDMNAIWGGHKPVGRRSAPRVCTVDECALAS